MAQHFPPQNLRESVYATAAFFDIFDRPLLPYDFLQYVSGDVATFLEDDQRLKQRDGYYFLPGSDQLLHVREMHRVVGAGYWKKVKKYTVKLEKIPFLRAVAVCNTLAFDSCTTDSDIDLFLIAGRGRIFTARFFSTLLFHLLGVRRHGKRVSGRFCLSFYVSDDGMDLADMRLKDDAYLYFWMHSLNFVYRADDSIYTDFYANNAWFVDLLPSGMGEKAASKKRFFSGAVKSVMEFLLTGFVGDWFENFLRKRDLKRFEKRKSSLGPDSDVVVSDRMLKFHNIDRRSAYNRQFFERYERLF